MCSLKKNGVKAAILIVLVIFSAACAKKSFSYEAKSAAYGAGAAAEMAAQDSGNADIYLTGDSNPAYRETGRKLITSSSLTVRFENLENGIHKLNALVEKYSAYASSINIYENSRDYTLRVPATQYRAFLKELMETGKTINYTERTEDVSVSYYDLESRLNTKKELIKTFQAYLAKADNIEDILSVESKIAELQADIDRTGSEFRALSDLIDYSTISLRILGPFSADTYPRETIIDKIKELLSGFGEYVSAVVIVLMAIVIYGIPSVILLVLLIWVLFGRIGLLRKLFKFFWGKRKKPNTPFEDGTEKT